MDKRLHPPLKKSDFRVDKNNRSITLEAKQFFIDFFKAFDSIRRKKMEQLQLANGFSKETVTAKMLLYRNTKAKVHWPDRDRLLQNYCWNFARKYISTLFVYYLPTLNIDRSNKRKWLYAKKSYKQIISCKNYNRCRLCRWSSASC